MKAIRNSLAFVLLFAALALVSSVWSATLTALFVIGMAIEGVKFCDALWTHILMMRRQPKFEPLTKINDFPAQTKRPVR